MADQLYNLARKAYRGTRTAVRNATGATNKCSSLFNIIKDNIPITTKRATKNRTITNGHTRTSVVLDAIDNIANFEKFECTNERGETPLVYTARKDKSFAHYYYSNSHYNYFLMIVKKLIKKGANINAQDIFGKSALLHAIDNDQLDLVHTLLDNNADPNLPDNARTTPLMYSFNLGVDKSEEIVKALLSYGADVNKKNARGRTTLDKLNSSYNRTKHTKIEKLIEEKGGIRTGATIKHKKHIYTNLTHNRGAKMYETATAATSAANALGFFGGGTRRKRRGASRSSDALK